MSDNKYLFPLVIMAALFFLIGFITTLNNSMIDFLSDAFRLTVVEKQLPNSFFYGAYVLSIPVGFLIHRIGYKNGVLTGIALVTFGFFLCIPMVAMGYYPYLSGVALFAVGIVITQVAASGPPCQSGNRCNCHFSNWCCHIYSGYGCYPDFHRFGSYRNQLFIYLLYVSDVFLQQKDQKSGRK